MATFSHRRLVSTRHEWAVPAAGPWGAAYEEIVKAVSAAWAQYRDLHGLPEDELLPGDFAHFHTTDEDIVISFVTETAAGGDAR